MKNKHHHMKNKMKLVASLILLIAFTTSSFATQNLTAGKKPNVIVIMTDDQGYPELSIHGNPILKTPNLDKLAMGSVRLGDFHAAPMCAPTRGQLMTGMDAAANGLVNVSSGRSLLKPELPTMGNIFMANGYNNIVIHGSNRGIGIFCPRCS
jgi:arylsulfatase